MKYKFGLCFRFFSVIALITLFIFIQQASAKVVTYPAPPGLVTSPDFTVKVNGTPVWVEKIGSDAHPLKYPSDHYVMPGGAELEYLNAANFSCSGSLTVKITASANIDSFTIRPKSRSILGKKKGHELTFTIPGPQKLYIEINGLPHLAIFANPLEVNPPKEGDQGVVYYGPGTHNPGQITLQSNQTIYIAGGAIVNANIRGSNLRNVKITGRGSLQGSVRISSTSNLDVNGIFIRNTKQWSYTLTNCRHSSYRNVKVFGYESIYNVDGINPVSCRDFTIDDCFMRCRDDCVSVKSMDYKLNVDSINVTNCVMVGWRGNGVTFGCELWGGPIQNILVKNCDILYAGAGGITGGCSGFTILLDGPAWVQNIRYEDIRVEKNIEFKNLELIITNGKMYGSDNLPGHIKGVYMKNIQWENTTKPFIIKGFSADNLIEDITFDHCKAGGKILTGTGDANFKVNSFTGNIKFIP